MKSSTEDTALVSSAPPFIIQLVLCMLSDKNVSLKKKSDTVSEPQLERNTQALLPSCRPQASAGLCAVTCPFHDRKTHTLGERLASPPKKNPGQFPPLCRRGQGRRPPGRRWCSTPSPSAQAPSSQVIHEGLRSKWSLDKHQTQ